MDCEVQDQVRRQLQLLCPFSLALASCWYQVPRTSRDLGCEAIMDLRHRPIMVYGSACLRPTHTATVTLNAFGLKSPLAASRGGPQKVVREHALFRWYFNRRTWFQPVAPVRVIAAFLIARDQTALHNAQRAEQYRRAAATIYRGFGVCPRRPASRSRR